MYYNRGSEMNNFNDVKQAWNISKKYTTILMDNQNNDNFIDMFYTIHGQFLSELRNKKLNRNNKKNYIKSWNTVLNTIHKNPKVTVTVKRGSIKLLHQTNVQRCYNYDR